MRYYVLGYKASPISPDAGNIELKGLDNTISSCYNGNTLIASLTKSVGVVSTILIMGCSGIAVQLCPVGLLY